MKRLRQLLLANWPLVLALLLAAYSWLLVAQLWHSESRLNEEARQQRITKTAEAATYHSLLLRDLRLQVQTLAESQEIANYLINRNLGMSMRYGLATSMFDIRMRLQRLEGLKNHRNRPSFERLIYVDERLRIVADTAPERPLVAGFPLRQTEAGLYFNHQARQVVIHAPVELRGQWRGTVVGVTAFANLLHEDDYSPLNPEFLIESNGREIRPDDAVSPLRSIDLSRLLQLPEAQLQAIELEEEGGLHGHWLAIRQPVPDAPLQLVSLIRPASLENSAGSRLFIVGAGLLPLGLILFALMFQRVRQADRALRDSRERFATVFEHISDAILLIPTGEFRIIEVNPRMLSMFGHDREAIAGLGIDDLSAGGEGFDAAHWQSRQQQACIGGMQAFPWHARDRHGRCFWVEVSMLRVPLDGNERLLVLIHDIDDSKRLEQELRKALEYQQELNRKLEDAQGQLLQSEKMASVGQLAAGIAHEINNPVGFIKANVGILKRYCEDCLRLISAYATVDDGKSEKIAALRREIDFDYLLEDYPVLIHETVDGIERVRKIVQDMRDFSHVDSNAWEAADLHAGIESTLNVVWNEIKYKAEVVREYGELPRVECLPGQINQVIVNLLINAAHAIAERGRITIRTGCQGESVWLEIEDDGSGIPADVIPRIFDPFFTTKPIGQGTGLGLSMAYGIIRKHNGRIDVDSTPGRGTRFRINLPIRRPETGSADDTCNLASGSPES